MFWNVIIKDEIDMYDGKSFIFTFFTMIEAIKFASKILEISNYHIEILQLEEKEV